MQAFDDVLLENFMNHFYGYGDYQGDYWLIGMEEGGGNSFEDIEQRLNTWHRRGRKELENVAEYHIEIGITTLFQKRPKIQRTWGKLIRVILAVEGNSPTTTQVRKYQKDCLGRPSKNNCLLELFPLPSPSVGHWLYGDYSALPYLRSRESYRGKMLEKRIAHLQERIRQYRPRLVLFYSFSYRNHWEEIAGVDFTPVDNEDFYLARDENQTFVIIKHPVVIGLSNEYFHRVGHTVATIFA
jgi:hypothetical protein